MSSLNLLDSYTGEHHNDKDFTEDALSRLQAYGRATMKAISLASEYLRLSNSLRRSCIIGAGGLALMSTMPASQANGAAPNYGFSCPDSTPFESYFGPLVLRGSADSNYVPTVTGPNLHISSQIGGAPVACAGETITRRFLLENNGTVAIPQIIAWVEAPQSPTYSSETAIQGVRAEDSLTALHPAECTTFSNDTHSINCKIKDELAPGEQVALYVDASPQKPGYQQEITIGAHGALSEVDEGDNESNVYFDTYSIFGPAKPYRESSAIKLTTEQLAARLRVLPLRGIKKIQAGCGFAQVKLAAKKGFSLRDVRATAISNTARTKKFKTTAAKVPVLTEKGKKLAVQICHLNSGRTKVELDVSAQSNAIYHKIYKYNPKQAQLIPQK